MADAAILSGFCDGVILVIHGQNTPAGLARQAMERLTMVKARILGVVLNGVDIRNPEYAYYRGYQSYIDPVSTDPRRSNGKRPVEVARKAEPSSMESLSRDLGPGPYRKNFSILWFLNSAMRPVLWRL